MHRPRPRHVLLVSSLAAAALAITAPVGMTVIGRMTAEPLPADFFGPAPASEGYVRDTSSPVSRATLRDPVGAFPTPFDDLTTTPGATPTDADGTPSAGSDPSNAAPGAPTTTPQTPGPVTTPGPGPSEPGPTTDPTQGPTTSAPEPTQAPEPTRKPTESPRPTTAPEPSPTTAPAPDPTNPSTSSRPDENSAGLPHGTKLDVHKGDLTITKDGTVIDGLDVRGFIRVHADNVVIKNSIVRGRDIGAQNMHLVQASNGSSNLVIRDTTLASDTLSPYIKGIVGWNFTLDRVRIHRVVDQVSIIGDNVTIKNSLLHGNLFYEQDPNYSGGPTHDDNIQVSIGTNLRFVNNVMIDTTNAAIMVTQDRGKVSDMLVKDNYMDGGACTVNLAEKSHGPLQGMTFRDNTFGTATRHPHCAILSPQSTTVTHSGNTFTDGYRFKISNGG
ncbi:hypothetical protein IGS67_06485 [Flavimobilis sp. GY10621]|uniref:Right handed beta helix region n=1 Tax=Flavimobilis rhizosphaerae TaxID=2775421 RepID=A0ABR9DPT1_9MICO|nr:hypothetical protein [Flavimobilis rhizosphaerae]MBD9699138.1 hypothetical protein [Flavimobilis rhizosphaerae]